MPFQKGNKLRLGQKSGNTVKKEAYRQAIFDEVQKEHVPIIQAWVEKAKQGDMMAIKELNERILGKESQHLDADIIKHIISIDE